MCNRTSTGNRGIPAPLLAVPWCQMMSLPKEYHRSSVMTYQLSEQHFPVAVPFHSLQEVTAQRAVIPALKTAPRCFFTFQFSVWLK